MIRICIIDDHQIVREGLTKLLNNLGDYEVVGEIENGQEFVANFDILSKKTDLFLLDYSMPLKNGLEAMREIQNYIGDAKILALTQNDNPKLKADFLKLGVRGFISKSCSAIELKNAIDQIIEIGFYNLQESVQILRQGISNFNPTHIISNREMEFIEYVCAENEYTYEEIAELMKVSKKTVDYYRNCLFNKLNIKSKTGLILFSFKEKLTPPFL